MVPGSKWLFALRPGTCQVLGLLGLGIGLTLSGCTVTSPEYTPSGGTPAPSDCAGAADDDNDLQDDNCNGLIDEGRVQPGSVVITELMNDAKVAENYGQYIELYNANRSPVDLIGWRIRDNAGSAFEFDKSTVIDGEGLLLLGRSDDAAQNGGYTPDVVYSGIELPLDAVELVLERGDAELMHELRIELNDVEDAAPGHAVSLDPGAGAETTNRSTLNWCASQTVLGSNGQFGTPGLPNELCPQFDHDGDGVDGSADAEQAADCDDLDAAIFPGAAEICGDGVDQDCDGRDLSCESASDLDKDGYTGSAGDCDDSAAASYPGAKETCGDGVDQDCDGEDLLCPDDIDRDGDGFSTNQKDCDDLEPSVYPGAVEVAEDGIDQDCDEADALKPEHVDHDADGYLEQALEGSALPGGDCDGYDAAIHPGAAESCEDGVDQDCSGTDVLCDEHVDDDGDGYADTALGDTVIGGDCDDRNPAVYPGAPDNTPDLVDTDCDGLVDEDTFQVGDLILSEIMRDPKESSDSVGEYVELYNTTERTLDVIGFSVIDSDGEQLTISRSLLVPARRYVVLGRSDDARLNGAIEVDYVYSGLILQNSGSLKLSVWAGDFALDEATFPSSVSGASTGLDPEFLDSLSNDDPDVWCPASNLIPEGEDRGSPGQPNDLCGAIDHDADGYTGDADDAGRFDCDDTRADVFPGAPELCDGLDNDCDGDRDEDPNTDCFDDDGDKVPEEDGDCDDLDASRYPGAEEVCDDGIDQNCDGSDSKCPRNADDDQDQWSVGEGDCADTDDARYPGADEVCEDGVDQDCDGQDVLCGEHIDDDGDGFVEELLDGVNLPEGDCDDSAADVYPGAEDLRIDWIDSDCDGLVDEDALMEGDLIVTEVMRDPSVPDSLGEYIELFNTTDRAIEIGGFTVEESDGQQFTIVGPLIVEGPSYVVFGRSADEELNGRVEVDFVFDGMILENDGEMSLVVRAGEVELDAVTLNDSVYGASIGVDPRMADGESNDDPDTWCVAYNPIKVVDETLAPTDLGSPGRANDTCIGVDGDGDGVSTPEGDCDDDDPEVSSNAAEVCGDGVDQDCDGVADDGCGVKVDLDGDGFGEPEGDCNDADSSIYPGAPDDVSDLGNLKDNDCDGVVDDDLIAAGDVLVAEIMKNPATVANSDGEWFELYNHTERDIDLQNWVIEDALGHWITIRESLIVKAGWQVVMGVNADESTNGGVEIDYEYYGLVLPNDGTGRLTLKAQGDVIDVMSYDDASYPDWFGVTMQLDLRKLSATDNDNAFYWCVPQKVDVDSGECFEQPATPGELNWTCSCKF